MNSGDAVLNAAKKTGGSTNPLSSHTHTQNPHSHYIDNTGWEGNTTGPDRLNYNYKNKGATNLFSTSSVTATNNSSGNNTNHNNWQPFMTVYMWVRIS